VVNTHGLTHPHPAPASTSGTGEPEPADPIDHPIDHPFDDLLRACSIGAALAGSHPLDQPADDVITAIRTDAGAPRVPARRDRPCPATHPGASSAGDDADPAAQVWEIVQRVQAGDTEAFGLIHQLYADTVIRFVYFRVGNRQLAEDLASETFLRALKRIGGFT